MLKFPHFGTAIPPYRWACTGPERALGGITVPGTQIYEQNSDKLCYDVALDMHAAPSAGQRLNNHQACKLR
jgi:hypothetical protein